MDEDFVDRAETVELLVRWEGKNTVELYGDLGSGKTYTVEEAARRALQEGKLENGEYLRIEFPPNTDLSTFLVLMNQKFPSLRLHEDNYNNENHLREFFDSNFSNLMLFFDNTENLELNFSKRFARWLVDAIYPATRNLRFRRIVVAGRVPLDSYPPRFSGYERYPYQFYLGPIDHKFVVELIRQKPNVEKTAITFDLLRDLRFATAGLPRALKYIISTFNDGVPNKLNKSKLQQFVEREYNNIREEMLKYGLEEKKFKLLAEKLFSVRSFEEYGLFAHVFDIRIDTVDKLKDSLYRARFITRYLLKRPSWHYSSYLTDPSIRWILSAYKALNEKDKFENIQSRLILLFEVRFKESVENGHIDRALKWFCEWLYHTLLFCTFRHYPNLNEAFEEFKEKINLIRNNIENLPLKLRDWRYVDYFKEEFSDDEFWWFLKLYAQDETDEIYKEFEKLIGSIIIL